MIQLRVEDKGILNLLEKLENKLKDSRPLMREVSETMLFAVQQNFEDQGRDEVGNKGVWPDLSDTQKDRREKNNKWPGQILRVENILYESIQSTATIKKASVHTNMIYATTMHFGAKKGEFGTDSHGRSLPWGDINPRPFFMLTNEDKNDVIDILKTYLKGA